MVGNRANKLKDTNMKKILIPIIAVAAIAACNKAEVVDLNPGEAIEFGNAFVDNATKAAQDPSYTASSLESFKVYGAVGGVNIFDGDVVSKGDAEYGSAWTIESTAPTQYWIAGADYTFDAVVDATGITLDSSTGLPTSLSYNTANQKDMLHNRVTTTGKPTDNNGLLTFTFTHLLSKVKFTVENTTDENAANYRYSITDINLTNANLTGAYMISSKDWNSVTTGDYKIQDITVTSATIAECAAEVLLIPGVKIDGSSDINKVGMTFNVNVQMKNGEEWKTITTTPATYSDVIALEANTAYNFKVTVGLNDEISFTAQPVSEWSKPNPENQTL